MRIYISGLYSGTNPQPGVGVARSLREAYPNATLIGVEYSNRCSGIHWPDVDELWLQRPWEEMNMEAYAADIKEALDSGALWISGFDLELMWLASVFPDGHRNLLTPQPAALKRMSKPAVEAHKGLPVRIPTFISTEYSNWELHSFCRQHDWKVWLKGPYYEAVRTHSWDAFESLRAMLARAWSTERLFLQVHVTGYEESVCFCAYKGELIDCVYMRKRELTEEGKTWAGDVTQVPEEFVSELRRIVRELSWTGGAELEMVRDMEGQLWLLECNPRFPAWIHGSTLAGRNLPALLVERATGIAAQKAQVISEEFTRVVMEIPVRPEFPLPPLPEPYPGAIGFSMKHPSGTLELAKRLHEMNAIETNGNGDGPNGNGSSNGRGAGSVKDEPTVPPSYVNDIKAYDFAEIETPGWLFLESTAASLFKRASELATRLSTSSIKVANAYSIKTNPDERLLKMALGSGFMAEAISLLEVQKALKAGFKPEQIVLNGPGKWWPEGLLPKAKLHAVFCDSIADLKRVAASMEQKVLRAKVVGVRLRTPTIASRFGIPLDTPKALETLATSIELLPDDCSFGVHFHMASSNVGVGQWWHLYESMLRWARSLEELTGREVEYLDVGGGWFPDDWHVEADDRFASAVRRAPDFLRHVKHIISEPGKAIAQPSMALAMRLLEVEESGEEGKDEEMREAVVDGSIAELPMHFFQPHRILWKNPQTREWQALKRGKTHLLGRLCMEHDIVARYVELPEGARAGDLLVFCDAGAYDRSMSYVFGRG